MTRHQQQILAAGALFAASAVALGAFGAHGLRAILGPVELGWWQTGVQYQMWHALGLLALGAAPAPRMGLPALLLGLGTLVFAGTLYVMAFTGWHWLGMITPVGGLLMISGWLLAAWRFVRPLGHR